MKYKFLFIQIIIFFSFSISFSQVVSQFSNNNYYGAIFDNLNNKMYNNKMYNDNSNNIDLSTIKGSPYENQKFQYGKVQNKLSGKSQSLYLRYNVFNDVIEIKENMFDPKTIGLIKSLNIYATINKQEYHYEIFTDKNSNTNEGYFLLLSKGTNNNLYLRKNKKFKEKVKAKDSFRKDIPATFIDSESYYIKKGRILFPVSTKKKEYLQQFSEKETELKKYIKSEKINLKNKDDLIKIFKYYDSLLE